jgi:hypothetical protein
MRALCLAVSLLLAAPSLASADDVGIATIDTLRARAAARGWTRSDVANPVAHEVWCAAPPCAPDVDRVELTVRDGAFVEMQLLDHNVGDGFALQGSWQASGAFTFRFARGEEVVDLTWELTYEPPGMSVGFTARDMAEVVALDPSDGAHAFELWIRRELTRHLASSASLLETALAQRASLRAAVARSLETSATIRLGSTEECLVERSTPQGTGFFDQCTYRVATAEERRAVLATLDARLARERALLRRHARRWHRVLLSTLGAAPPASASVDR